MRRPRPTRGLSRQEKKNRQDSSGQVISPTQFSLPDYTQHSQQTSVPGRDSKPQCQQASRHRPTSQTARPQESAPSAYTYDACLRGDCVKVQSTLFCKEKLFSLKVTGKRPLQITNITTYTDYKDYSKTKINVYYINNAVPISQ